MKYLQIKLENDAYFRKGDFPEMHSEYVPGNLTSEPVQRTAAFHIEAHFLQTDTISAVLQFAGEARVCALNFANANVPGGAYTLGGNAQEEALCRASLLYYTIRTVKDFYNANRLHVKPDYTHGMIYSSGVPIIRQNDGTLLDVPQQCDFITCPAVNRTYAKAMFPQDVLDRTMQERITQIILLAAREHPDVLVLGAFGCGVFGNKREVIYPMFEDAINRYLPEDITVIFADPRGIS